MQIICAIETINSNNIIHFNINPGSLLVFPFLKIKLSSFTNAKEYNEKELNNKINIKIPKGEKSYMSPEFFNNSSMTIEEAKQQDYYALGMALLFIKFGFSLVNYKSSYEDIMNYDSLFNELDEAINFIKSQSYLSSGCIHFLCSLIKYKIKDRISFDKIYRNKWLNENKDYLELIFNGFSNDEERLIMELKISDYLVKKEKKINYSNMKKYKFKKSTKKYIK